ncbi:helix-hairpin-helix domain-containing protein [Streptococcus uberis]|uniref:helix-hairpin-helix domain-containing protein n=1 Tax=Streptococcus uberis TaxID=1349 RepID=UPI0012B50E89|nr:helix-hairpin-helix domain-containing protein [Streptococcus uberis]MCK1194381.1 helix-hairpin-helix domain-containing protein [Streptococcus uberis]MCK1198153.1 helix-hairpin-helix domain-containing protein [Streptococcus uberis]MCK1207746.1 helix-hairpin-helix domain-containing protein [Streptococcus uberis]MCK1219638.1 helix-hairpin-helix domain-containing protein [Streptococcus uberis]MCK1236308.1 helix-hairpin-helix domain-containing protein [Streptococcus uberis]
MNDITDHIKQFLLSFKEKKLGILLAIVSLVLIICLTFFFKIKEVDKKVTLPSQMNLTENLSTTAQNDREEEKTNPEMETIMVDIKGAVVKEGVYQLQRNSRVTDAIQIAGGLRDDADPNAINLAQKLSDEAILYVARKGENKSIIDSQGQQSSSIEQGGQRDQKVNINKATIEDLRKIPGIGEKRAQEILDARDSKGGFKSIDDLLTISGIGQKTLEKIKNDIIID